MGYKEAARTAVSVILVLALSAGWGYKSFLLEEPVNPIITAVVILFALASAYVVFGKTAFEQATETYEEVKGDGSGEGSSGSGDSGEGPKIQ